MKLLNARSLVAEANGVERIRRALMSPPAAAGWQSRPMRAAHWSIAFDSESKCDLFMKELEWKIQALGSDVITIAFG